MSNVTLAMTTIRGSVRPGAGTVLRARLGKWLERRRAPYFPNESRNPIVRLNTSLPGFDSTLSAQK